MAPAFGVVPAEEREHLLERYPYTAVDNDRLWQDYLYRAEDLMTFAGRRYSGQRNHINKFRKLYPDARFRPLAREDAEAVEAFWEEFHRVFNKEQRPGQAGGVRRPEAHAAGGEALGEGGGHGAGGEAPGHRPGRRSAGTPWCATSRRACPSTRGSTPPWSRPSPPAFAQGLRWINREDDAGDRGLRTSKLQYLPAELGAKVRVRARNELASAGGDPQLWRVGAADPGRPRRRRTGRNYNRLCLDDERNRWWGYDYRRDLKGELTEDYFLEVARHDFDHPPGGELRRAAGGDVHRGGGALQRFDYRGGCGAGLPDPAGVRRERLRGGGLPPGGGVERLRAGAVPAEGAKCYRENEASRKMLSACMRASGEDETFYYFEKKL